MNGNHKPGQGGVEPPLQSSNRSLPDELQALLEKQVSLARNGRSEEVSSLAGRVDEILALASFRTMLLRDNEQCNRIQQLYNELCLMLTVQKSELGERLKKIQTGKNSLLGYRNASSAR